MPKPGPNTVVAPKKISGILEDVFSGKEVKMKATKSERSMLDRLARETGRISVDSFILVRKTNVNDVVKGKKEFKKKVFMMFTFNFSLLGYALILMAYL